MKMPFVQITYIPGRDGIVSFKTNCGRASGVVYVERGENETQYDIQTVERIDEKGLEEITPYNDETASFCVIGAIVEKFDDGTVVAEALGFTFWIEPERISELPDGDMVKFLVKNLTFYI